MFSISFYRLEIAWNCQKGAIWIDVSSTTAETQQQTKKSRHSHDCLCFFVSFIHENGKCSVANIKFIPSPPECQWSSSLHFLFKFNVSVILIKESYRREKATVVVFLKFSWQAFYCVVLCDFMGTYY